MIERKLPARNTLPCHVFHCTAMISYIMHCNIKQFNAIEYSARQKSCNTINHSHLFQARAGFGDDDAFHDEPFMIYPASRCGMMILFYEGLLISMLDDETWLCFLRRLYSPMHDVTGIMPITNVDHLRQISFKF